ncbi:MAG: biosynthetic arginine decarboxylase, partial [Sinobacteraceae bacterium]|nr:biosynthetic arginine decarboxylase [Nevskiaceae bacterium]
GLEAGSKPELAAVLGLAPSGAPIICNGYKDREYLRRALIGTLLGHRVHVVVEKLSELPLLLEQAAILDVKPHIGLRVRLAARFASTQQNTGGEKSKFGLSAPQLLEAVAQLKQAGQLGTLDLLHIHLGSQVANIADLRHGVQEAARYYVELRRLGVPLKTLDVGGGLGVDYEGSHSRSLCSMNYGLHDYAHTILQTLQQICAAAGEPVPDVISESGRALTAHHAVLITEVIDEDRMADAPPAPAADDSSPAVLRELAELNPRTANQPLECLHDAATLLGEARNQYLQGSLSLADCAAAESAYYALAREIRSRLDLSIRAHREAAETLADTLAAKYFCNFSLFQSVPDAWAIDQVFPIVPLQRLNERPHLRAKLCDLTCDSDGKLEHYVDREGVMPTLAVHERRAGEAYLLGIFMVGAYQEILGDMHNLFGDTHAVNVVLDATAPAGWRVAELEHGDVAGELLRYVHLSPEELARRYREKLATAGLPAARSAALLAELDAGLNAYTYLGPQDVG